MKKLLVLLIISISILISAQPRKNLQFIHYSTDQGLSSSEVSEIVQDKDGFIWVGTEDGLNRFDSYNFKVYRKKTNDTSSLIHNFISTLFVDSQGLLWIGTQRGLSIYNRNFDSFINYLPDHDNLSNQANHIMSIAEDKNKRIFIGLQDGQIFVFNRNNHTFRQVAVIKKCINYLYFDSDGLLWVLSEDIYIYNHQMQLIKTIHNPEVKYFYKWMIDDGDKYWICTLGSGMFWYDKKTKSLIKSLIMNYLYEDYINIIYKDKENNIWVGCTNSLKLYDRKNDSFHYYYYDEKNKFSLSTSGIRSFLQDNEGNYWALTAKGGLNVSLVKKKFMVYNPEAESNVMLTKRIISSIIIDSEGKLWTGFFNAGLDMVDLHNKSLVHFENDPLNSRSLSKGSVLSIYEDSKKNIWVGSYLGGLQKYDKTTKTFYTYKNDLKDTNSIGGDDVRAMIEDKQGNVWIATCGNGLDRYDPKTNIFYHYIQDVNNTTSWLVNNWLYCLLYDHEENLWIGSSFGLSKLRKDQKTFENYYNNPNDSSSLSNNFINYIYQDSKRNIWIGTNEGLNLYNPKQNNFRVFLQKDGLPNNVIKGILDDKKGNIWVSTNMGISQYTPNNNTFRNYDIFDGMASNEFNQGACAKHKNGQLFFGSNDGIVGFYPDSIKENSILPPVYITGFKIFNKPVSIDAKNSPLEKDISQTKKIILEHGQSSVISFEYVSVSYIQSEKKQYAYMMEGFEKEWNYVGTKRDATYTNLNPGKYIFRVKASNNDGIWNENGASIEIVILPPWWRTIWFRVILVVLIIGLLIGFYLYRISEFNRQKLQLEKLVMERTKEIEEKNQILTRQTIELHDSNTLLEERQQYIQEQAEELKAKADELYDKNEILSTLNATKDKFFTIIAHDLKNPFNAILGFCELLTLRYDKIKDDKRKTIIHSIFDSSQRVYKLLENLLQWARSQTGAIEFKPEEFDLIEVIESNIVLVENLLIEKNLKIENPTTEQAKVYADKNMITTIIRNLIANAIKFTEDGTISIHITKSDGSIIITIQDNGVGISHEKLKDIFNIAGSKSTFGTRGESGTGLGLILCKEFIEKNNGTIWVESELGKGSTFGISLPKA